MDYIAAIINWKDSVFKEDDFYENFDAPMWFDLSNPHQQRVDDGWFCKPDCNHADMTIPTTSTGIVMTKTPKLTRPKETRTHVPALLWKAKKSCQGKMVSPEGEKLNNNKGGKSVESDKADMDVLVLLRPLVDGGKKAAAAIPVNKIPTTTTGKCDLQPPNKERVGIVMAKTPNLTRPIETTKLWKTKSCQGKMLPCEGEKLNKGKSVLVVESVKAGIVKTQARLLQKEQKEKKIQTTGIVMTKTPKESPKFETPLWKTKSCQGEGEKLNKVKKPAATILVKSKLPTTDLQQPKARVGILIGKTPKLTRPTKFETPNLLAAPVSKTKMRCYKLKEEPLQEKAAPKIKAKKMIPTTSTGIVMTKTPKLTRPKETRTHLPAPLWKAKKICQGKLNNKGESDKVETFYEAPVIGSAIVEAEEFATKENIPLVKNKIPTTTTGKCDLQQPNKAARVGIVMTKTPKETREFETCLLTASVSSDKEDQIGDLQTQKVKVNDPLLEKAFSPVGTQQESIFTVIKPIINSSRDEASEPVNREITAVKTSCDAVSKSENNGKSNKLFSGSSGSMFSSNVSAGSSSSSGKSLLVVESDKAVETFYDGYEEGGSALVEAEELFATKENIPPVNNKIPTTTSGMCDLQQPKLTRPTKLEERIPFSPLFKVGTQQDIKPIIYSSRDELLKASSEPVNQEITAVKTSSSKSANNDKPNKLLFSGSSGPSNVSAGSSSSSSSGKSARPKETRKLLAASVSKTNNKRCYKLKEEEKTAPKIKKAKKV